MGVVERPLADRDRLGDEPAADVAGVDGIARPVDGIAEVVVGLDDQPGEQRITAGVVPVERGRRQLDGPRGAR